MTFDEAFDRLLGHEGGYVNDPKDAGGETNWGISKRQYPTLDIRNLTREAAKSIYLRDYWQRVGCDQLPSLVRFAAFDLAVNAGTEQAIKALQLAVACIADGVIGPITRAAIAATDPYRIAVRVNAAGLEYRTNAKSWPSHGRGWTRRVVANLLEL